LKSKTTPHFITNYITLFIIGIETYGSAFSMFVEFSQ
jgi:hypothetical protein